MSRVFRRKGSDAAGDVWGAAWPREVWPPVDSPALRSSAIGKVQRS